jgi:hypothetical protein
MRGSARIDDLLAPWRWFRERPLVVQIGVWAVVAVVVAIVGLSLEQSPPTRNAFAGLPDTGPQSSAPTPGAVVNQGGPGREGTDVQLPAGALPTEVGNVSVSHFKATSKSVAQLFNEVLGNRGRAGLNSNQLLKAACVNHICQISYVPDGPGAGRIIESQGPIWDTLEKDPTWRAATLIATVGGPDIVGRGGGHAHGGPPGVVLTCTRQAVKAIGVWGIESAPKIESLCQFGKVELKGA